MNYLFLSDHFGGGSKPCQACCSMLQNFVKHDMLIKCHQRDAQAQKTASLEFQEHPTLLLKLQYCGQLGPLSTSSIVSKASFQWLSVSVLLRSVVLEAFESSNGETRGYFVITRWTAEFSHCIQMGGCNTVN